MDEKETDMDGREMIETGIGMNEKETYMDGREI